MHNPHLENSFNKTLKVIKSCNSKKQVESAIKMVKNFKTLYGKVGYVRILNYKLEIELDNQIELCQ
tara:strand:+ start:457 stop:654 length:198 start_codon:yes stop_codon:yes gene_type:complete